jgi:hypothetical protein
LETPEEVNRAADCSKKVRSACGAWHDRVARVQQLLTTLSDEQLLREVATDKNRGIYLVAYYDASCTIPDLGPRLHPELDSAFLQQPDKSGLPMPSLAKLKQYCTEVHRNTLTELEKGQAYTVTLPWPMPFTCLHLEATTFAN